MKAMIFAAGLGTRLKPLTDTLPKALVAVGGKPLLQHIIEKLKLSGFDEIIINIHHFGQQIIDFVEANRHFGIRIAFSDEREELLDTGGGIKKAAWFFDDGKPFLVHNVDILSNIDLREVIHHHTNNDAEATLLCSKRETNRYLLFDERNHLRGWINKKTGETKSPFTGFQPTDYIELAFSGIQMIHPSLLREMDSFPRRFSIIDFYLTLCATHKISAYQTETGSIIDVGKPDSIQQAKQFLQGIR